MYGILTMCCLAVAEAASPHHRPSVVFVTVDTLRTDRLSAFGYHRPTSPNLDKLLDGGLKFMRARTIEPLTNPALCSMLTGVSPHVHGASRNGLRVREGIDSLPKILNRNGWRTGAVVSNWTLKDNVSRLGEHFDDYVEVFTRKRWYGLLNSEATGEHVTSEAIAWTKDHLDRRSDQRFLLWVHYVEPHAPYRFHKEYADRLSVATENPSKSDRYDTEVAAVDHAIGRLVDWLYDHVPEEDLFIFFAADHGESLGEHSYWGHGRYLYEPSLAIPMGMVWHGRIQSRNEDAPALIIDVVPTVLDLLELPIPDDVEGYSWAGVIDGADQPAMDRGICYQAHKGAVHGKHESEQARSKGLISVGYVRDEHKEILRVKNNSHMLFDLREDPQELENLVTRDSDPSQELLQCVATISAAYGALDRIATRKLDDETVEQLRALGYLE